MVQARPARPQYYADIPCTVTVVPTKSFATVGGIVEINLIALTNGAARKKQVVETDIPGMAAYGPCIKVGEFLLPSGLIAIGRDGHIAGRTISPGFAGLAHAGHIQALAAVGKGLEDQERTGQRRWEPELQRLEGLALVGLNRLEEAQRAFEEALRVGRRQQAKAYELRAATSLAQLWGEQGRRAEACDLLAPVYGWFTEGFNTADLKNAKGLLIELT